MFILHTQSYLLDTQLTRFYFPKKLKKKPVSITSNSKYIYRDRVKWQTQKNISFQTKKRSHNQNSIHTSDECRKKKCQQKRPAELFLCARSFIKKYCYNKMRVIIAFFLTWVFGRTNI